MILANLLILLIIAGCAVYQYFKGTLVRSFVTIISAVCAGIIALGYFELIANLLIKRGKLVNWAQPLSFLLLFVSVFAILETITIQLTRKPIDFGFLPERIGRIVGGIISGIIISGLLLTALALTPLSGKFPYKRFDDRNPRIDKPQKVLLNTDGLVSGLFSIVSGGSFSGERSFTLIHPDFLDQVFLNRANTKQVSILTVKKAIEVPKPAVWPAPDGLKDSRGPNIPIEPKSGHSLTIVRMGIKKLALKDAGKFTLSQLRVICRQKSDTGKSSAEKGINVYPIGYLKTQDQLQIKKLNEMIEITTKDFARKKNVKWLDFAFNVPNNYQPVLIEFKQNNIAELPRPVSAEKAPPPEPFEKKSKKKKSTAKP